MPDFTSIKAFLFGQGDGQLIVAGLAGGLVRWLALRGSFIEGVISMVVGGICALYLSPLVLPLIGPILGVAIDDLASRDRLSAFIVGIGGVGVVGYIMDLLHKIGRKKLGSEPNEPPNSPAPGK